MASVDLSSERVTIYYNINPYNDWVYVENSKCVKLNYEGLMDNCMFRIDWVKIDNQTYYVFVNLGLEFLNYFKSEEVKNKVSLSFEWDGNYNLLDVLQNYSYFPKINVKVFRFVRESEVYSKSDITVTSSDGVKTYLKPSSFTLNVPIEHSKFFSVSQTNTTLTSGKELNYTIYFDNDQFLKDFLANQEYHFEGEVPIVIGVGYSLNSGINPSGIILDDQSHFRFTVDVYKTLPTFTFSWLSSYAILDSHHVFMDGIKYPAVALYQTTPPSNTLDVF